MDDGGREVHGACNRSRSDRNLDWKHSEEFDLDRFRQLLGVEPGKLKECKHLNLRAIQPAIAEVKGLSDFGCSVEPVTAGREVVKVRLSWWLKRVAKEVTHLTEVCEPQNRPLHGR